MNEDNYNLSSEFDTIWKNVEEVVVSHVIADLHATIRSVLNIQSAYDDMIARWTAKHSLERMWLDALRQKDPDLAERVLQCAKSLQLKPATKKTLSKWPFIIIKILLALYLSLFCFYPISLMVESFAGTLIISLIICYSVISICSRSFIRKRMAKRENTIVQQYRAQLNHKYNEIAELLQ